MTFREFILEKQDIHDKVYFEQDDKKIYIVFVDSGETMTYSKKLYYIYGGASKTLQIYSKGNKLVAEYWNAGWNSAKHAKNIKDARGLVTLKKGQKIKLNWYEKNETAIITNVFKDLFTFKLDSDKTPHTDTASIYFDELQKYNVVNFKE